MEDDLHTQQAFYDRVNEILAEFSSRDGFREEITLNLSGSSAVHALSARVNRIEDGTVRIDYDGSGSYSTEPELISEAELRASAGPLENEPASCPEYYYLARGVAADAMLNLVLYPRSDTARTNGIKFWAQVTPTAISALSDTLPVQQREERFLIPGICLALAEVEATRDPSRMGSVALWEGRWERAKTEYLDQVEDGLRGGSRRILCTDPY